VVAVAAAVGEQSGLCFHALSVKQHRFPEGMF
jgi:hypothetical protein